MAINYSKGNWTIGKNGGTVVTDDSSGFPVESGHSGKESTDYYGGNLIAESILKKADAQLISAAPEMGYALRSFIAGMENDDEQFKMIYLTKVALPLAKEALIKAGIL